MSGQGLVARLLGRDVPAISPDRARSRMGDAVFLDVRELSEFRAGHVPDAVHIPLGDLRRRLPQLQRERPIVAVCRSGNRSAAAARLLASHGYEVHNLAGGMVGWVRAGLPVRTGG